MPSLEVSLKEHSYQIIIQKDALARAAGEISRLCRGGNATIVTDETVWELHGGRLSGALEAVGANVRPIIIPSGEKSKSLAMLERLCHNFHAYGMLRGDPVIAFGGGVVGDLAGFAASVYMRGVPYIQIPTTLLAQVDSSVGGKVAVNLDEGKNLVGSFYQPRLVAADTSLLSTLPEREWLTGAAEIVKHAAIGQGLLIPIIEGGIKETIDEAVYLNCVFKATFVEKDEKDTAQRMMLNFGHTFGHAIEKLHSFSKYNHGEAVAVGMALAARTGELLGVSEPGTYEKVTTLMERAGLKFQPEDKAEDIVPLMSGDKKNEGKDISLILLRKIGSPFLYKISPDKLLTTLQK